MGWRQIGLVRAGLLSAMGLTVALVASTTGADARHRRHHSRRAAAIVRHHASLVDSPGFAAMVIDANSGRTLFADHENDLRHPASITKVMTLYLLFEKLESGEMRLDTRLDVSRHAASMAPTKLGLRPGSSIAVEDAIKAIVTKSANDMAVAVAEAIGGDEGSFAALMTRKAHALGMSRTTYVNASGLPDDRQITTAHDLTILGRSIHDRFPHYYRYFSTPSFTYAGSYMPNHNHLMSRIEGMDGIKTGYTRASGFNLLSSVSRGGRHIVAVVMGGHTAAGRDRIMASLIDEHMDESSATRFAEAPEPEAREEPAPTVQRVAYDRPQEVAPDRGPSLIAPTLAVPPVQRPNDRARTPNRLASVDKPRPAFIAGAPRQDADRDGGRRNALDGSTSDRAARSTATTATPSAIREPAAKPEVAALRPPLPVSRPDRPEARPRAEESRMAEAAPEPRGRGDWVIQIGATDAMDKANDLLARARSQNKVTLASARPVTEKVRKGEATLYRARFAGLDTAEAEQACRSLKRTGFACFAMKD